MLEQYVKSLEDMGLTVTCEKFHVTEEDAHIPDENIPRKMIVKQGERMLDLKIYPNEYSIESHKTMVMNLFFPEPFDESEMN